MFRAFAQAFRTPDLRQKILITLLIMALYRLGTFVPAPGVSSQNINACLTQAEGTGLLDMFNLFSGGALLQLSVFALGILPYITASIIMQVMRVAVPRLDDLYQEGQSGQTKITQYTRYLTVFLAILQSTTMLTLAINGQMFPGCTSPLIPNGSPATYAFIILAMTTGTVVIMWFAEIITERGVGNGMSLLIFTSIVSTMPTQLADIWAGSGGWTKVLVIVVLILLVTLVVVYVESAQRRIPVQYARRMVGRRTYGGTTTYIPLKINMSGVIPVIFSSSIMMLPNMAAQFASPESGWAQWIQVNMNRTSPWYLLTEAVLILGFAYFYTSITFNPDEVADNLKRYGGFVPGFRAGRPTAEHLRYVVNRLTFAGAIYLAIIASLPSIIMIPLDLAPTQMPFGGTTLLIMVSVGLQTVKDINAQLQQHHYEGFLK
ncbi:preprotein translocase subunit SecY [Scrofimicrobium sp. R131]|uniref:Protein translocase subunit SecY n=1 Tax=Scrofimicrobium appendicitidis TaxID=3079930 RepID=A0AAU7V5R7_9ACTO